ncbi:META domain-containing protein [Moraxella oblonga]|uniref:META domain-containing protein n=1 Tax=Moraxella oblonga TaxID=200413 RepID=UPI000831BA55|nr:META domain-containing protein [Moraxella oblonga]
MKSLKLVLPIVGIAMMTACQPSITPHLNTTNTPQLNLYQPITITHENLTGSWQLMDNDIKGNKNKPLILKFENNQVSVINGCNNLRANYQIQNSILQIGSPISTRMMCENPLMDIDNLATQLLKGNIVLEKQKGTQDVYMKISSNDNDFILNKIK